MNYYEGQGGSSTPEGIGPSGITPEGIKTSEENVEQGLPTIQDGFDSAGITQGNEGTETEETTQDNISPQEMVQRFTPPYTQDIENQPTVGEVTPPVTPYVQQGEGSAVVNQEVDFVIPVTGGSDTTQEAVPSNINPIGSTLSTTEETKHEAVEEEKVDVEALKTQVEKLQSDVQRLTEALYTHFKSQYNSQERNLFNRTLEELNKIRKVA
jgi:hypothetical protein